MQLKIEKSIALNRSLYRKLDFESRIELIKEIKRK